MLSFRLASEPQTNCNTSFFSNHFYVIDIQEFSNFQGILGFDFINRFYIIIDAFKKHVQVNNILHISLETTDTSSTPSDATQSNTQCSFMKNQEVIETRAVIIDHKNKTVSLCASITSMMTKII